MRKFDRGKTSIQFCKRLELSKLLDGLQRNIVCLEAFQSVVRSGSVRVLGTSAMRLNSFSPSAHFLPCTYGKSFTQQN